MAQIKTTPGQRAVTVALTPLTISDSAEWADVDTKAAADRQIEYCNCGDTDLFLAFYDVLDEAPNAASVLGAYIRSVAPGQNGSLPVKAGEAIRCVRAEGSGTLVAKIRVIQGGI